MDENRFRIQWTEGETRQVRCVFRNTLTDAMEIARIKEGSSIFDRTAGVTIEFSSNPNSEHTPFKFGYELGQKHARIGDPHDTSDARCTPLERERDQAGRYFRGLRQAGDFYRGYELGYEEEAGL